MRKNILILFSYALIINILNYLNVNAKVFFVLSIFLSIICSILIERIVIRKIRFETEEDHLTGLQNKRAYSNKKTFFNSCTSIGAMFLDVNNLKLTNDTYGHTAGDELIISVSKVLEKYTEKGVFSYRFGGDEFVMIFTNITKDQFLNYRESLLNDFSEINLKLSPFKVHVAIGLSYQDNLIDIENVLQEADYNMYMTKKKMKRKRKQ